MLTTIENVGQRFPIFQPPDYRYGPSILVHPDGRIDMFTCSPAGVKDVWDYIRYRRSTNGGFTWTPDVVALGPSPGTRDHLSTCDPGAVMINGRYYLGYTSTEDSRGTNNQVYVARANAPEGPYEKWDGSGWGGPPQPIITYSDDPGSYGAGEPSLVLVGKKLYVYSSYDDPSGGHTDCATVDDATVDDWPAKLVPHGHVITYRPNAQDSTDVKYFEPSRRPVQARYLQLAATQLGADQYGNHYLQLAEMSATVQ